MPDLPIGQLYRVKGRTYRLTRASPPTPGQIAIEKDRQRRCAHDGGIHYTDPLSCGICGADMPKKD